VTAPEPSAPRHTADLTDPHVVASGKVSEALEWVERARGRLYDFHQLIGHADLLLDEAVAALEACGRVAEADVLRTEIVGRNVVEGRWTFQLVEEFNDLYYDPFVDVERRVRDALVGGRRHVLEAATKEQRRSSGVAGHERGPQKAG